MRKLCEKARRCFKYNVDCWTVSQTLHLSFWCGSQNTERSHLPVLLTEGTRGSKERRMNEEISFLIDGFSSRYHLSHRLYLWSRVWFPYSTLFRTSFISPMNVPSPIWQDPFRRGWSPSCYHRGIRQQLGLIPPHSYRSETSEVSVHTLSAWKPYPLPCDSSAPQ